MLTHIYIKNFKKLHEVDFELGQSVVLIGPNNSGKTTALQALALWDIGLRRWIEKRGGKSPTQQRLGVAINRRDLIAIPVPDANLLWHDLHVRNIERANGDQRTQNIRVDIRVDGVSQGKTWQCGMEFDYANQESFYCRPLRLDSGGSEDETGDDKQPVRMAVPEEAAGVRVAYLPPMSGLADREFFKQPGEIGVLIGQGQTAQVLRNLCFSIVEFGAASDWPELTKCIDGLFGVTLLPPQYVAERSEVVMAYKDQSGVQLDISSAGRGLQQTLLLIAHLYRNPGTVLLLDEPDAHLEILRQRQIYQLLTETAAAKGSQIIAASHSEVVLNEAADRDMVVAFVGKPHRIDDRGSQVLKSLRDIGFDDFYQAEQTGWILYLEGSTDLTILIAFARTLGYQEAIRVLERPFLHAVGSNVPSQARDHFFGLREAKRNLVGVALFDRINKDLQQDPPLMELMWKRREIENYLCLEDVLLRYAANDDPQNLFAVSQQEVMAEAIAEVSSALRTLRNLDPWSPDIKATDDFLDPLFKRYFEKLKLPNLLRKTDYHVLARLVPADKIDPEVVEKLDAIVKVANQAKPRGD